LGNTKKKSQKKITSGIKDVKNYSKGEMDEANQRKKGGGKRKGVIRKNNPSQLEEGWDRNHREVPGGQWGGLRRRKNKIRCTSRGRGPAVSRNLGGVIKEERGGRRKEEEKEHVKTQKQAGPKKAWTARFLGLRGEKKRKRERPRKNDFRSTKRRKPSLECEWGQSNM